MKIIATIPQTYSVDKYLVEMTEQEIKLLTVTYATTSNWIYVGQEFNVSKRYERLISLENNREKLDKAIKQIRAVADIIEPLESVVSGEMPVEEVE